MYNTLIRFLLALCLFSSVVVGQAVELTVDATKPGPTISRHLFGQFAEHLGTGVYEGIWVGPDSKIPNTRGIRNDVVGALKDLKVPNVRWPGGCFADEYHWRNGIGVKRGVTLNPTWGGVIEPNTFGTHEFMDFVDQIGSEAFLSINLGSGTVNEAADWIEYMTSEQQTDLAKQRAANGHPKPYEVPFLGIGNESWDCGGNMSPDFYLSQLKMYARFVRNFDPAQQGDKKMLRIAVGPGGTERRFVEWTETVMKGWKARQWSWDMEGLSLHNYTVINWEKKHSATDFGETEYAEILKKTLEINAMLDTHIGIMDKYDPEKKIALVVDEWGAWYAPTPGTNPGFLVQQNSQRDAVLAALNINIFARRADRIRMANIAQMVNVLQAMILTDKEKMLLTPTYHVFKMYVPFQDATLVPVTFNAGTYAHAAISLPRVDAIAAKGKDGKLWISITNLDANNGVEIDLKTLGMNARSASGEALTSAKVDSINTFDQPNTVMPKPISASARNDKLTLTLEPRSVTVVSVDQ
ncbi:MAG: alpha-L-arabinofuranosidase C-terminal domain-containing protein [bacterium]|nr:alpha-L-arabinofuranosidase C-terminal domain-containing protein [bacterium]